MLLLIGLLGFALTACPNACSGNGFAMNMIDVHVIEVPMGAHNGQGLIALCERAKCKFSR